MDWILTCKALILGIVEGLTEFLPVSSTGHLIVVGHLLKFDTPQEKTFDVVIQLGAILAVCWEYRQRIVNVVAGLPARQDARRFAPVPVALALVVGGVLILWVEARQRNGGRPPRVHSVDDMSTLDALKVGLAQCFALIPGMSRSGSTIIGGMLFGLDRRVATEFSFFLAIPIIFGATFYELYKDWNALSTDALGIFTVGFVAAFISAFACVRWLLRYVASHDFTAFAWYRIGFGLLILVVGYSGGLSWAD